MLVVQGANPSGALEDLVGGIPGARSAAAAQGVEVLGGPAGEAHPRGRREVGEQRHEHGESCRLQSLPVHDADVGGRFDLRRAAPSPRADIAAVIARPRARHQAGAVAQVVEQVRGVDDADDVGRGAAQAGLQVERVDVGVHVEDDAVDLVPCPRDAHRGGLRGRARRGAGGRIRHPHDGPTDRRRQGRGVPAPLRGAEADDDDGGGGHGGSCFRVDDGVRDSLA